MADKTQKPRTASPKATKAIKAISIDVYDSSGKKTGSLSLPNALFGQKVNRELLDEYVYNYLQNQRQGNASTKTRGEVKASTRKIYRQKGTGRARHGAPTAPIFVGGGVYSGPKPRTIYNKMNKKQKQKALLSALSFAAKEQNLIAIEESVLKMKPKTKEIADLLNALKLEGKTLIVLSKVEQNGFLLSTRNLQDVKLVQGNTLNPYEILNHKNIVFMQDVIKELENHFLNKNESK